MASFTVIYDACLFYPVPLRDLMIRLAQTRRFHARWTEGIQHEWLTALLRHRPEFDEAKLQRTMTLINQAVPDCQVTGYGHLIPGRAVRKQDEHLARVRSMGDGSRGGATSP